VRATRVRPLVQLMIRTTRFEGRGRYVGPNFGGVLTTLALTLRAAAARVNMRDTPDDRTSPSSLSRRYHPVTALN